MLLTLDVFTDQILQLPSSTQLQKNPFTTFAQQLTSFGFTPSPTSTPMKKKPTPVPDELKDEVRNITEILPLSCKKFSNGCHCYCCICYS